MDNVAVAPDKVAVGLAEAESIARMLRLEAEQDKAKGFSGMSAMLLQEAIGIEVQVAQAHSPILVRDSWRRLHQLREAI